jgi:hypothetical protein
MLGACFMGSVITPAGTPHTARLVVATRNFGLADELLLQGSPNAPSQSWVLHVSSTPNRPGPSLTETTSVPGFAPSRVDLKRHAGRSQPRQFGAAGSREKSKEC